MLIHVWSSCSDTNNFFGGVVTPSEKLKVCYLWIIGSLNDDGLLWNPWRVLFNIYDSFNYLSSLLDIKTFFKLSGCPWNPFPAQDLEESEQMLHQAQAGGVPALSHRTLEMANWSWPERWREGVGRIIGTQQRKNNIAYSGIQHCKLTPISSIIYPCTFDSSELAKPYRKPTTATLQEEVQKLVKEQEDAQKEARHG